MTSTASVKTPQLNRDSFPLSPDRESWRSPSTTYTNSDSDSDTDVTQAPTLDPLVHQSDLPFTPSTEFVSSLQKRQSELDGMVTTRLKRSGSLFGGPARTPSSPFSFEKGNFELSSPVRLGSSFSQFSREISPSLSARPTTDSSHQNGTVIPERNARRISRASGTSLASITSPFKSLSVTEAQVSEPSQVQDPIIKRLSPMTNRYSSVPNTTQTPLSSVSTPASSVSSSDLANEMKIITSSRRSDAVHEMDGFDGLQYTEFWGLTPADCRTFINWNKLEFQKQNLIFEYYVLLKRIRFNVRRMVYHYGVEFKKAEGLTAQQATDYERTFLPLQSFSDYLDKLVVDKLKAIYDNKFFINDRYVVKISINWFTKLESDYDYISRSMIYLAKLSTNEQVRKWIGEVELTDETGFNNNYAASSRELFSSYFLKFLTSLALVAVNLKKLYTKMKDDRMIELSQQLFDTITRANKTSDYISSLNTKTDLNDKMISKDYLYLEMVDIFNRDRTTRVPVEIYLETQYGREIAVMVLCDNYFLPLILSSNEDLDRYVLNNPPIPLQYASFKASDDPDNIKHLTVKDPGNKRTYEFVYDNSEAPALFKNFVDDFTRFKEDAIARLTKEFSFKVINCTSFHQTLFSHENSSYNNYNIEQFAEKYDLVTQAIENADYNPSSLDLPPSSKTDVLSVDCFFHSNNYMFAVGTKHGLFLGIGDKPNSWKHVCSLSYISKIIVVHNSMVYMQCGPALYQVSTKSLYKAFKKDEACNSYFKRIARDIESFEVGTQVQGVTSNLTKGHNLYLFYWKEKVISYSILSPKHKWKLNISQMRASFPVTGVQFLYPDGFTIDHVNDNNPIFYLSDLTNMRNILLPRLDEERELKIMLRGERPIAAFRYAYTLDHYDIILVYSRHCVFVNDSKKPNCFKVSRNETLRFDFECTDAAFDDRDGFLVLVGAQNMEIWKISRDIQVKSELVSCIVAPGVYFLNKSPMILGVTYGGSAKFGGRGNQVILHLKKI